MGVLFKKACTLNQTADEICMTSSTTLRSPALASLSPHIGNGGVLPNRRTLDPPSYLWCASISCIGGGRIQNDPNARLAGPPFRPPALQILVQRNLPGRC